MRTIESERKRKKICRWNSQGIICDDWNGLYERVLKATQCELCPKVFSSSRDKQVDHDHHITDAPNVRNIVCQKCNIQKSDFKCTSNTGERYISKLFSKKDNRYYYCIQINRDGKRIMSTSSVSLEKSIVKRDLFIKNNPIYFK